MLFLEIQCQIPQGCEESGQSFCSLCVEGGSALALRIVANVIYSYPLVCTTKPMCFYPYLLNCIDSSFISRSLLSHLISTPPLLTQSKTAGLDGPREVAAAVVGRNGRGGAVTLLDCRPPQTAAGQRITRDHWSTFPKGQDHSPWS